MTCISTHKHSITHTKLSMPLKIKYKKLDNSMTEILEEKGCRELKNCMSRKWQSCQVRIQEIWQYKETRGKGQISQNCWTCCCPFLTPEGWPVWVSGIPKEEWVRSETRLSQREGYFIHIKLERTDGVICEFNTEYTLLAEISFSLYWESRKPEAWVTWRLGPGFEG